MKLALPTDHINPLRVVGATALALIALLIGTAIFATRAHLVSIVSDDSFYYLQMAKNLALTGTSTFDGVTRTSGYHPLFAAVLAALYAMFRPGPDLYVHLMLTLNVVLHLMTGVMLYFAGRRLRDNVTGMIAALLFLANPYAALWTLSGMEASINGLALALFFLALVPPVGSVGRILFAAIAGAAAVFARTDNLIVAMLGALFLFMQRDMPLRRRFAAAATVAGFAGVAMGLWILYCWSATGDWAQGSARIKMLIREYKTLGMSPIQTALYTFGVFQTFVVKSFIKTPALKYVIAAALFAGAGRWVKTLDRERTFLAFLAVIPFVFAFAYSIKLTRTATWYYVPAVIALTLVSACLARVLMDPPSHRAGAVALVVALLIAAEGAGYFGVKLVRGRNAYQRDMLELAEWMQGHLPASGVVGAWDSGIYSYYSRLRVINLDGLMNNDIAKLMEANRPLWPKWKQKGIDSVDSYELWYAGTPSQYWQYWHDRKIGYIVGNTRWLRGIPAEWDGGRLVTVRGPDVKFSKSPKALYEIQWQKETEPAL